MKIGGLQRRAKLINRRTWAKRSHLQTFIATAKFADMILVYNFS